MEKQRDDTSRLRKQFIKSLNDPELLQDLEKELGTCPLLLRSFVKSADLLTLLRQLTPNLNDRTTHLLQTLASIPEGREALVECFGLDDQDVSRTLLHDGEVIARCLLQYQFDDTLQKRLARKIGLTVGTSLALGEKNYINLTFLLLGTNLAESFTSSLITTEALARLLCTASSRRSDSHIQYSKAEASSACIQILQHRSSLPDLQTQLEKTVVDLLASCQPNQIADACSVVAFLISVEATLGTLIFTSEGFLEEVILEATDSEEIRTSVLWLLSAACVSKRCREHVITHGDALLQDSLKDMTNVEDFLLGTTVLCKLGQVSSEVDIDVRKALIVRLADALTDERLRLIALEALMFLSTYTELKDYIGALIVKPSLQILEDTMDECGFFLLTILTNLTQALVDQSEEEKQMQMLASSAREAETGKPELQDTARSIVERITSMTNAGLPVLLSRLTSIKSKQSVDMLIRLLKSMASVPAVRSRFVQAGCLRFLINSSLSQTVEAQQQSNLRMVAAHAVAKFLISLDPNLVFSLSRLPSLSGVAVLLSALEDTQTDLLMQFETLLALTNMSSMGSAECGRINTHWDVIVEYLFSPHHLLCRAAMELICNLVNSDDGAGNVLSNTPKATSDRRLILALLESDDYETQRAACGAFATLSSHPAFSSFITLEVIRTIKHLLQPSSSEIIHRVAVAVQNLIQNGLREQFRLAGMKEAVLEAIQVHSTADVVELCRQISESLS